MKLIIQKRLTFIVLKIYYNLISLPTNTNLLTLYLFKKQSIYGTKRFLQKGI